MLHPRVAVLALSKVPLSQEALRQGFLLQHETTERILEQGSSLSKQSVGFNLQQPITVLMLRAAKLCTGTSCISCFVTWTYVCASRLENLHIATATVHWNCFKPCDVVTKNIDQGSAPNSCSYGLILPKLNRSFSRKFFQDRIVVTEFTLTTVTTYL